MQQYVDKESPYFDHTRRDIGPALPARCGDVLEIGCGTGATLGWLRQRPGTTKTIGIEIFREAAQIAGKEADIVHCLDFENDPLPVDITTFDTVLCLDVLEHMVNPWATLDRIVTRHLKPEGRLIVTLPNIRHHTVSWELLVRGKWRYEDAGILDRTHLRFFTRETAIDLMRHRDLGVPHCHALSFAGNRPKTIFNRVTFGVFEGLITPQYLLHADKQPRA